MAVDDVVPTVATTQAGIKPAFRSSASIRSSSSGIMAYV